MPFHYLLAVLAAFVLVIVGCPGEIVDDDTSATDDDDTTANPVDADGDGYTEATDCDDEDPSTYPGAEEQCDGLDNDCDDVVPEDELDMDGDGLAECEGDCDDGEAAVFPGATFWLGSVAYSTICAGTFTMGSPMTEVGRELDEDQHEVTLTRDIYMGQTEVTQLDWESVMGWNPIDSHVSLGEGDDYPVYHVNWYEALAYANELSSAQGLPACYDLSNVECEDGTNVGTSYMDCMNLAREGINVADVSLAGVATLYECEGYRLPTEAEWEYAARAGGTAAFYNGGELLSAGDADDCGGDLLLDNGACLDDIAWYCGNGNYQSEMVGRLQPNHWGLYDTSGNLLEWCWDWYGASYGPDATDPEGSVLDSSYKILRGGSYSVGPGVARVASRGWSGPENRGGTMGFRLARSMP